MNATPHIFDATQATFAEAVLMRSADVPVLVDFWAEWCGPCRMLTPILTKLVEEHGGRVLLAKVNTDQNQNLAMQFGIRSLPTVKLIKGGAIVDEFIGVLPEHAVRAFLEPHLPQAADETSTRVETLLAGGDTAAALDMLANAEREDPDNDSVKLQRAALQARTGAYTDARETLARLSAKGREDPQCSRIEAQLEFAAVAEQAPPPEQLQRRVEADPQDCEARYQLSAHLVLEERFDDAMAHLLEIVRRDRGFGDDAGRKALVKVFAILGGGDLVSKYRGLLARSLN